MFTSCEKIKITQNGDIYVYEFNTFRRKLFWRKKNSGVIITHAVCPHYRQVWQLPGSPIFMKLKWTYLPPWTTKMDHCTVGFHKLEPPMYALKPCCPLQFRENRCKTTNILLIFVFWHLSSILVNQALCHYSINKSFLTAHSQWAVLGHVSSFRTSQLRRPRIPNSEKAWVKMVMKGR